jgi:hypothetical protein
VHCVSNRDRRTRSPVAVHVDRTGAVSNESHVSYGGREPRRAVDAEREQLAGRLIEGADPKSVIARARSIHVAPSRSTSCGAPTNI